MSATAPLIESVRYFACGHCVNHLQRIFRHHPKQKRVFQAGVFLIKHRVHGHILYDTGYGTALNRFYWKYLIYRAINPTYVRAEDTIAARLEAAGIAPESIGTVIVSHLHPDHIGGLKSFPHAHLLLTQGCWDTYRENRFRSLIFPEFLPDDLFRRPFPMPKPPICSATVRCFWPRSTATPKGRAACIFPSAISLLPPTSVGGRTYSPLPNKCAACRA